MTAAGAAGADSFNVTIADGASGTFNGGGSVDAYTVNVGSTATLTGNTTTETIRINATAASTVTLGGALTDTVANVSTAKTTVGGGGAITIQGTKAQLNGTAIVQDGSSATVEITDAAAGTNASKMVVDVVRLKVDPGAGTVTVNDASKLLLLATNTDTTIQLENVAADLTTATALVDLSHNQTKLTTGSKVDTLLLTAVPDETADTDPDANGTANSQITVTELFTNAATKNVVVAGASALALTTFTNTGGANIVANDMTGKLTIGATTAAATFSLGSAGDSVIVGNFASAIYGNGGNDTLTGGTAADSIYGGDGNDSIAGGGTAANTISGGAGNDTVTATAADTITLGAGNDSVIAATNVGHTISDFNITEDRIIMTNAAAAASAIDLRTVTPSSGAYAVDTTTDFTLTGVTTTNLTTFVQLGNTTSSGISTFTLKDASTNYLGDLNDVVAIGGGHTATVQGGTGNDTFVLPVGTAGQLTVSDFTVGKDKVIITGTATAGAGVNLTSVTPTAGAYTIGGGDDATNAVVVLQSGGTAFTATDVSTMIQLGSSATAYNLGANAANVTGGVFNDFINLGAGGQANVVNFINGGGYDTFTTFVTGEDDLSFDLITGITATAGTAVAANASKVADAVSGAVYVFADSRDGTGTAAIDTFTTNSANGITAATILVDVADFLNQGLGSANGERYIAVINDGAAGNIAYVYDVTAGASGITADGVTLIGKVTMSAAAALVAGDIA
ncbi:MAG: calcium-binding protein [Oxalobacteraceae bacterium]|nr:calcium-binding protein [Oxalobacteraceae bacterium]